MPEMRVCLGCGALVAFEDFDKGRCAPCNRRHAPIVKAQRRRSPEAEARIAARPSARLYASRAWKLIRRAVLERDHWTCRYCGRPANTVDHVVSLDKGGAPLAMSNLVACCAACNGRKGNR